MLDNPVFTVVIPLIPQHDFEIKRILKILTKEQHLIKELIVCRSETKGSSSRIRKKYLKFAESVGFVREIKIDTVKFVARDGTNRNRGWKIASTRYVVFMDADDLYSVNRLTKLLNVFKVTDADAIVHSYNSSGSPSNDHDVKKELSEKVLVRKNENGIDVLVDQNGNELKVHFAHITVRNDIRKHIMFTDRFPGADWEFATQLVSRGYNVEYLTEELSAWSRNRSARYKLRLYKMRFLKTLTKSIK